jgi:hypothetical protein
MHLAVLHDIQLSEPSLIKWVASCVNDVAELILLCQNEHRVQESFHRLNGLDKTGARSVDERRPCKGMKHVQFVGFIEEEHRHFLD